MFIELFELDCSRLSRSITGIPGTFRLESEYENDDRSICQKTSPALYSK